MTAPLQEGDMNKTEKPDFKQLLHVIDVLLASFYHVVRDIVVILLLWMLVVNTFPSISATDKAMLVRGDLRTLFNISRPALLLACNMITAILDAITANVGQLLAYLLLMLIAYLCYGVWLNSRLRRPFLHMPGTLFEEYVRLNAQGELRRIKRQEAARQRRERLLVKFGLKKQAAD